MEQGANRQSPPRPSTLIDVAERVGVSPRTVSRVVNDEGGFSEATRQRVLDAVADLGYRPNLHARGLISGRSGTIGFIAPVLSDPFFPELAAGVQRAARAAGLTVLFAMSDNDPAIQDDILDSLAGYQPDGVVIFPVEEREQAVGVADRGLRLVVVDTELDHPNAVAELSDLEGGTIAAIEHLVARGGRKLAMLANLGSPLQGQRRRSTFIESIPAGIDSVVVDTDITREGGAVGMHRLLDEHPDVDGVFCFNDVMAVGAIGAALRRGHRVPDDVAVVGCDDIEMGTLLDPALTTIRIDRELLGAEAVRLVRALAEGESGNVRSVLPVELIVRQSA